MRGWDNGEKKTRIPTVKISTVARALPIAVSVSSPIDPHAPPPPPWPETERVLSVVFSAPDARRLAISAGTRTQRPAIADSNSFLQAGRIEGSRRASHPREHQQTFAKCQWIYRQPSPACEPRERIVVCVCACVCVRVCV